MWFFSKKNRQKSRERGGVPFLRKALPEHHDRRSLKKESNKSRGGIAIFLWGVFLGTIFYLIFFSPFLLIEKVQVSGMNKVSGETLQAFLESQLEGKYFRIFPKRIYTVVQPRVLEDRLRSEYPLLATVSVKRIFPHGLNLLVTERKKIILWNVSQASYLVDEEGITHDSTRALSEENASSVITLTDTSDKPVTMGEKVFDPSYGAFIIGIDEKFPEELGMTLEPHYTAVSRFAEELRAKTSEGWEVYFSTEIPIETSLDALKLLFEKELPQEKRLKLAYIDLRAENRVYYAFRDGTNGETPPVAALPDTPKQSDTKDVTKKKK